MNDSESPTPKAVSPLSPAALEVFPEFDLAEARVARGGFHDVVLVPGSAAIRIARDPDAVEETTRRHALLARLASLGLPFATPEPLTDVRLVEHRPAFAISWVGGAPSPKGEGDPRRLRRLLDDLAAVNLELLRPLLAPPHSYAGGDRWAEVMLEEAVPSLPLRWREEARARIQAALELHPVPEVLVHGDLAGDNVRWSEDGELTGVIDWDLAAPWDQAVDAACLAWYGWPNVREAVDEATYRRARTWYRTFGIEQIASALVNGDPASEVEERVAACVLWLERTK